MNSVNNYCFAHKYNETYYEFLVVTPNTSQRGDFLIWNGQNKLHLEENFTRFINRDIKNRLYLVTNGKHVRVWDNFVKDLRSVFQQYVLGLPQLLWQPSDCVEDFEHLLDLYKIKRSGMCVRDMQSLFNYHLTNSFTTDEVSL